MRGKIFVSSVLGIVVGLAVIGGHAAATQREVTEDFEVEALPFPYNNPEGRKDTPGCNAGVEGTHKVSHEVKVPFTGLLTASFVEFEGDWDIEIANEAGELLMYSGNVQEVGTTDGVESTTALVRKGDTVNVAPCNWQGSPRAIASYTLRTFRPSRISAEVVADDDLSGARFFTPRLVTIESGEAVLWRNVGDHPHKVTDLKSGSDSGFIGFGEYVRVYRKPGTYRYVCVLHPGMKGRVIVE